MTSQEQALADEKMRAEIAKMIAEMFKINAEMFKINAETAKISAESRWYPAVLGAGFAAGLLTIGATFAKLFLVP
jgi:roadblock/LC7 domain-containing protein